MADRPLSGQLNTESWFYKNCQTQRKRGSKCCKTCPMRKDIEAWEQSLQTLTDEQREEIRQTAVDMAYSDAQENWDYMFSIVRHWVESKTPLEQAEICSSDEALWRELFTFDPRTGEEWDDS